MKLIYTGANGNPVTFGRGVRAQRPDGLVFAGEAIEPDSDRIAAELVRQGVARVAEEPAPEPPPAPMSMKAKPKKEPALE